MKPFWTCSCLPVRGANLPDAWAAAFVFPLAAITATTSATSRPAKMPPTTWPATVRDWNAATQGNRAKLTASAKAHPLPPLRLRYLRLVLVLA